MTNSYDNVYTRRQSKANFLCTFNLKSSMNGSYFFILTLHTDKALDKSFNYLGKSGILGIRLDFFMYH